MSLGRCAACDGFVNPSDERCPNCDAAREVAHRDRPGVKTLAAAAATAVMTLMACYGGPIARPQPIYAPCGPEGAQLECMGGFCDRSVLDPSTQLCTVSCTASGMACPRTAAGVAGVCVESNGSGQCYLPCTDQSNCEPYGMSCLLAFGSSRVCVPDNPGAIAPYGTCARSPTRCGMSTMCLQNSISGGGFAAASHCTHACSVDAECPYQGVCAAGQCYLSCDPARADGGDACAGAPGPGMYRCALTPDGMRNVCVPM